MTWAQTVYEKLLARHARRDWLFRKVPHCPACDTEQVQIISDKAPAQWRCRKCKHRFEFEPLGVEGDAT